MFVQDNHIVTEVLEFEHLDFGYDCVREVILAEDAEIQDEYRVRAVDRRKAVVTALIGEDYIVAEIHWALRLSPQFPLEVPLTFVP